LLLIKLDFVAYAILRDCFIVWVSLSEILIPQAFDLTSDFKSRWKTIVLHETLGYVIKSDVNGVKTYSIYFCSCNVITH